MIFFFYGPNSFAARQQIARLKSEYLKKTASEFGVEKIEGKEVKMQDLLSALQAAPLLTTSRLVIIEDLAQNKQLAEKIGQITQAVSPTTVAVFYDSNADQRTSYFKHLSAGSKAIKFHPLSGSQLQQWVKREAQASGAEIDGPAILKLIETAGEDQWRLQGEIIKLAGLDPKITVESIAKLVVPNQNESIFDLVENMTAGRVPKAMSLYRQLRSELVSEMYILSMIIWQLRNLLLAKTAGNVSAQTLSKNSGMSPFVAGKMLSRQLNISEEALRWAFLQSVETDYEIKTGAGDAETMIERLIYNVAEKVRV
ncbi:MAG TPA: DNA polymerase III subunit delta [Candidatus Dormibacteraeota bacterium]|nr:DNA polymerase III subunit delta [Candidatus Dormibacteraeota bacterium]